MQSDGPHPNSEPAMPRLLPLRLSLSAGVLLVFHTTALADDQPVLDGPRTAAFASASRSWLLEPAASPLPAAWPLPRRAWLEAPRTPSLDWLRASRPLAGEAKAWPSLCRDSLQVALGLRLEQHSWRLQQDSTGSLREMANGLDLELSWSRHGAAWLHVRDAGLEGGEAWTRLKVFQERESWLWSEVQVDASLTHDEQRTGVVLESPLGGGRVRLALLRDHLRWGSGLLRTTLLQGNRSPAWSQVLLQAEWGPLHFSQSVGELFSGEPDSSRLQRDESGLAKLPWREKWLAAHRVEWTAPWGGLGFSELWVIGDRRPGPGACLPAGLYWSEQHAQGDRDNVLLGLDGRLRLPAALPGAWELHAELTLDDYTLGDLGSEEEGQRSAWLAGVSGCPLPVEPGQAAMSLGSLRLPGLSWLTVEWSAVRPYMYGHFYDANRFDHGGLSLGATPQPNTRVLDWEWRHESATPGLRAGSLHLSGLGVLRLAGSRLVHGANPPGENVGGDRLLPHRDGLDASHAPLLAGLREEEDWLRGGLELAWRVEWREHLLGSLWLEAGLAHLQQRTENEATVTSRNLDWGLSWRSSF